MDEITLPCPSFTQPLVAPQHAQRWGKRQLVPEIQSDVETTVRAVLRDVLGISQARVDTFRPETPLFGALPELDSMAVAGVLTELEDRLGMLIDDDEVDGEMLETFGGLTAFAAGKVAG